MIITYYHLNVHSFYILLLLQIEVKDEGSDKQNHFFLSYSTQ